MKRLITLAWVGTLLLVYLAGSVAGPAGLAAADQAAAGAQQAQAPGGALPPWRLLQDATRARPGRTHSFLGRGTEEGSHGTAGQRPGHGEPA